MTLSHVDFLTKAHFRLLEKTSPKAAARKAVSLWLTPPKYKPSMPEQVCLQHATARRIVFRESPYQSSLETYYTLYNWGSGLPVLLVHDWGGSAAQVARIAKPLVDAGFAVFAFDALAHGDSPGQQTDLVEFVDIIKDVHKTVGSFHAIFALSIGAIATTTALQEGVKTSRLVVAGAAASIDYYLGQFTKAIEVSRQTMGRISTMINSALKRNIKEFSIINIVPGLNIPGLILHDKLDEVVKYTEAVSLAKLWHSAALYVTDGLGRAGLLSDASTINRTVEFIKQSNGQPAIRIPLG